MNIQPTNARSGQDLLARMGQIPVIVQGKVSERKAGGKVTGYKLQRWRNGCNQTRHVPAGLVDAVREGTNGYKQFIELVDRYVAAREADVFESPTSSKKKPTKR